MEWTQIVYVFLIKKPKLFIKKKLLILNGWKFRICGFKIRDLIWWACYCTNETFRLLTFGLVHGLRTPNEALFSSKSQTFWFGQINFRAFEVILAGLSAPTLVLLLVPSPYFPLFNQPLFLQKTKPLYPNPTYLFGIGSWIWAAKNLARSPWSVV